MRKWKTLCFCAIICAGVLALWSHNLSAADCPIKIGGLAPLSAPGAVTGGEAMRDAMQIAVDEVNAAGGLLGCRVQLVMGDTEGLPEKATAVMEKLINQDKVVAVGGEYHSSPGIAAMEVAHKYGIPIVFAETWNDGMTAKKYPEVFRVAPLSSEVADFQSRFAAIVPGVKKVAMIVENTDFGRPNAEASVKVLEKAGIQTVMFPVDIGTQDFSSIIQRMKAAQPDLIIVIVTGEASYNFTQQAADAGIGPENLPMICDQTALESKAYWTNVPAGNYAFVMRVGIPPQRFNDVAKSFEKTYMAKTGKKAAESYAFEAYDSVRILMYAIKEAKSSDKKAIINALEKIKYVGALGTITFPYGMNNPPDKNNKEDKWWHQFPEPAITMLQYQKKGQDSTQAVVVYPTSYKTGEPVYVKKK
ncbi:MAG TPA: ABC transporter substrate-binding protein [Syntrophobacteria bacterium]|nr:ABC transporter substrate-binding protein [Syntrophobacteria bacterium]